MTTTARTTDLTETTARAPAARDLLRPLASAAVLGLTVPCGVAFAHSPLAHNAARDVRHITVEPSH